MVCEDACVLRRIEYDPKLKTRLCSMCNGPITGGDFICAFSEENHSYVCESCVDRGMKIILDVHLRLTQKKEQN